MKKKLIASFLAAAMLLTLTACGGKNENPDTPADSPASMPESSTTQPDSTGQDAQPETTPDDTAGLANTATQDGVYLYDGTFLATGETIKLNDEGASIDMPSATIDLSESISWLFDGKSPIGNITGTNVSPGQYWRLNQTPSLTVLNNTQEMTTCANCLGVYADLCINRDASKDRPYAINEEIFGKGRETYPIARILEILGDPMGAYCTIKAGRDENGNEVTRPQSVVYFWKSNNFENGNLVIAFEIQYSWMYNNTTVEELSNSHLHIILTDHMDGIAQYNEAFMNSIVPGMQELGLYDGPVD